MNGKIKGIGIQLQKRVGHYFERFIMDKFQNNIET